jgi:hypothetical protein
MLQKRYQGFLKTRVLWESESVFNLKQLEIESPNSSIDISVDSSLRLGKYIERLVAFELQQHNNISVIAENVQIQEGKNTLGELDCLLIKNNQPVHLEIIYKFYLYDAVVGETEIDHFIGPNRKDSLIEKLIKLKEKQLPLLRSNTCKPYLDALGLKAESMVQQVYFKAQLFIPYRNQNILLDTLNNACVVGFYITKKELNEFIDCKFYVPIKKDWLIIPHTNVNWLNFNDFRAFADSYFEQKFSALCWVKFKNGNIKKIFIVSC